MRERISRFMAGRNGNDQLNNALLVLAVAMLLSASLFARRLAGILYPATMAVMGYVYFRMLSRNIYQRQTENARFLRWWVKRQAALRLYKERWVQRRDYKFFTCPACKTVLRVPRGKGKIKLVCRRCGTSFTGKS